jgi:predicted metalloprotease
MRGRHLIWYAVAATLVAACFAPEDRDSGNGGSGGPSPSATDGVAEFERDAAGAVGAAEEYWAQRFEASGRSFRPIRDVIPYRRDGEAACGGQPLTRNNAAYCGPGDFIAFDVAWAARAHQRIGDAFTYFMLGHEYAHGIQARLGLRFQFTIQQELQADCMAGAYLGDSVRSGRLTLEEGDLEEFRKGLAAVGDDPGQAWFEPGSHGTVEQRTDSFFGGYERSVDACGLD